MTRGPVESPASGAETPHVAASVVHAARLSEYFTRSRSTRQGAFFALQPLLWRADVCALNAYRAAVRPIERMLSWLRQAL